AANSSPADGKGEEWADVPAVRLLQCAEDFEDGQYCPRVHVVRGDVEPVSAVLNGHLRVVRAVFLRVHEEVSGGDPRPVKGRPVRAPSYWCNPAPDVFLGDTHTLGEKGHDLQYRPHIQVDRVISQRAWKFLVGLLGQLWFHLVPTPPRGQMKDLCHFLYFGRVDVRRADLEE